MGEIHKIRLQKFLLYEICLYTFFVEWKQRSDHITDLVSWTHPSQEAWHGEDWQLSTTNQDTEHNAV